MTPPLTLLPDALERNRSEERRRALRALLARPLLDAMHPGFVLTRRHAQWLREWLSRETGWTLQLERDFARLHKRPADSWDDTRAAFSGSGTSAVPFNRRRYALLCLIIADLERGDAQITLGRLGEGLRNAASEDSLEAAGLRFALDNRDERRDLVHVVRLLIDLGVLTRVAGDEEAFVQQGADRDVLYDVNRRLIAALLVSTRGPSLVELEVSLDDLDARIAAITETFVPDTPEGRNRRLRHNLTRRLLDDPVVYVADLSDEEAAYLTNQRAAIVRRIEEATGLVAEIRAEGIAMVDPQGELTDERIPAEGTEGHATLLLAEHLARAGAAGQTFDELAVRMRTWAEKYQRYWKKAAREPGAERDLCRQAIRRLAALRLVIVDGRSVHPRPALSRFALAEPDLPSAGRLDVDR